jgi:hypothetical protein
MKVQRTIACARHGHLEFRIAYDTAVVVVADDAEWLLRWLEESVAGGTRFETGQTCQVGWVVTKVQLHESGDLFLWEPDMRSLPIQWSAAVSNTLAHMRVQKDVVESLLGAEDLTFPSMRQSVLVCTRLAKNESVVMERADPSGADSGWFCGCREGDHDHNDVAELRRVSLYEAAIQHAPQIVPYLALPPGVLVCIGSGAPDVFRAGEPLTFKPGSYLAARHVNR